MDAIKKIAETLKEHRDTIGGYIGLTDIVPAPSGTRQPSDIPGVRYEWVDQRGDEAAGIPYSGHVYIELVPGAYGKFEFQT